MMTGWQRKCVFYFKNSFKPKTTQPGHEIESNSQNVFKKNSINQISLKEKLLAFK